MNFEILSKVESIVLLTGESGTGKTSLAKNIHKNSSRSHKPFVTVDLASISENLLESELFGHVKGSFTGAISNKEGFLDKVNGGTLFLDEIGELPLSLQKKLLRLIEERVYNPIGSTIQKKYNGTIIVATNKDLVGMMEDNTFREDLYYRLNVFTYKLPPLRDMSNAIKNIILKNFNDYKVRFQKFHIKFSDEAMMAMMQYCWKGNYRELKNVLEYVILTCNEIIEVENLPFRDSMAQSGKNDSKFHQAICNFEKKYLYEKLLEFGGKINKTSKEIGISKVTLISKVKKYDINISNIKRNFKKGLVVGL